MGEDNCSRFTVGSATDDDLDAVDTESHLIDIGSEARKPLLSRYKVL